jgi:type I restriction enzyme R subunit
MKESEAKTRQKFIDKELELAGWNISDPSSVIQELDINLNIEHVANDSPEYNKFSGHQFSDYALLQSGKPIAVIEAKKTSKDAKVGKEQALQYSQNLQKIHGGDYPFIFMSNGHEHRFWEYDFYPDIRVYGFPTKEDLEWMKLKRETRKPLSVELINTNIAGRYYQIEGIRKVLEGIESKKREFLLIMATGTGKTRTAAALFDVLIRARWAKRILFLVDRIALQEQALSAFKEHIPTEPSFPKKGDLGLPKDRRIYVETYPSMLRILENSTSSKDYVSPFFFDVIIADESHRSIYNTYKQILDYFHAIKIGLTATPTSRIDHNTFNLFNCESGQPTFAYSYEEALAHNPPYLCDFEVLSVRSKFQVDGIRGQTLTEDQQEDLKVEGIDPEEINFDGTDLETKVTNAGTNALIVREFMEECIKDSTGTIPGKTIFFCVSKDHARRMEDIFNRLYPEYHGKLARVIVSEDKYVHGEGGLLDQFKKQDFPRIAISVDMLDTGVDVREIVNLVFAKPVYSFVKFWQMIGRGTRVLDDDLNKRKPWCKEKNKFLIIDCWSNFEFFKLKPKGKEPGEQIPLAVRMFKTRVKELELSKSHENDTILNRVIADLKKDIEALPKNNVVVKEAARELSSIHEESFWNRLNIEDLKYLSQIVAPIMRAKSELDYDALRFEMELIELHIAMLEKNADKISAIEASLLEQISRLPLTINVVAEHQAIIEELLESKKSLSTFDFESLRSISSRLSPLMRYKSNAPTFVTKLSLADLTVKKEYIDFGPGSERMTTVAYRENAEKIIRELEANNLVIQKIKKGESISDDEIKELGRLLESQKLPITEEFLRKVYDHKTATFMQFIKAILGLEKLESWTESVESKFSAFIKHHNTLTSLQIQFLQTLKTFILQNRKIEKGDLIQRPFTQIDPNGIRGVFKPEQAEEIIEFAKKLVA